MNNTVPTTDASAATTAQTLTAGQHYDTTALTFTGWTEGDGSDHEGYNVSDYFSADGRYLGPDEHGIEPLVDYAITEAPALRAELADCRATFDATAAKLVTAQADNARLRAALQGLVEGSDCSDLPASIRCCRVRCLVCDARELLNETATARSKEAK